jgi:hypothetical protein
VTWEEALEREERYVIRTRGVKDDGTPFTLTGAYGVFASDPATSRHCASFHHELACRLLQGTKIVGSGAEGDVTFGLYLNMDEGEE